MKIENQILDILSNSTISGNLLTLPAGQLDRKTYTKVNDCLDSIGGKWNRKQKGHLFDADPTELLENLLLTGETTDAKKEFQFFPTPRELARRLVEWAEIKPTDLLLEPSAGTGNIADMFPKTNCVEVVELMPKNAGVLVGKGYKVHMGDFLEVKHIHPDRVVMNPPFTGQQDIDHIRHAFGLLNPNGILVSVVSESPFFRTNKKSKEFLEWLKDNLAEVEKVEAGAFKESGTMVPTRIIKLHK